jgi:hypothetical protein
MTIYRLKEVWLLAFARVLRNLQKMETSEQQLINRIKLIKRRRCKDISLKRELRVTTLIKTSLIRDILMQE